MIKSPEDWLVLLRGKSPEERAELLLAHLACYRPTRGPWRDADVNQLANALRALALIGRGKVTSRGDQDA